MNSTKELDSGASAHDAIDLTLSDELHTPYSETPLPHPLTRRKHASSDAISKPSKTVRTQRDSDSIPNQNRSWSKDSRALSPEPVTYTSSPSRRDALPGNRLVNQFESKTPNHGTYDARQSQLSLGPPNPKSSPEDELFMTGYHAGILPLIYRGLHQHRDKLDHEKLQEIGRQASRTFLESIVHGDELHFIKDAQALMRKTLEDLFRSRITQAILDVIEREDGSLGAKDWIKNETNLGRSRPEEDVTNALVSRVLKRKAEDGFKTVDKPAESLSLPAEAGHINTSISGPDRISKDLDQISNDLDSSQTLPRSEHNATEATSKKARFDEPHCEINKGFLKNQCDGGSEGRYIGTSSPARFGRRAFLGRRISESPSRSSPDGRSKTCKTKIGQEPSLQNARDTQLAVKNVHTGSESTSVGLSSYLTIGERNLLKTSLAELEPRVSHLLAELPNGVLHIGFTPEEITKIAKVILDVPGTRKRKSSLQEINRLMSEKISRVPEIEDLVIDIKEHANLGRSKEEIRSFLSDVKEANLRSKDSVKKRSLTSTLLTREIGTSNLARYGTQGINIHTFLKDIRRDFRCVGSWGSTSGDVNTTVWSPDDKRFVLGSTVPDDHYNKNNNLLLGDISNMAVRELPDHRTLPPSLYETSHDWMYQTVADAAFSRSGTELLTASYDKTVKIWDLTNSDSKPTCSATLSHEAKVDRIATSTFHDLIATGNQKIENGIRIYSLSDTSNEGMVFPRHKFSTPKASRHPDLNIWPSCIQWGPSSMTEHLLLAGFEQNLEGVPRSSSHLGGLELFDVHKGTTLQMTLNTQSISACSWFLDLPAFMTVGAVPPAGSDDINKAQSIIRSYDCLRVGPHRASENFRLDKSLDRRCIKIDANIITICPQNSCIFAVAYEDGATRLWDRRFPRDVLHELKHGPSLEYPDEIDDFGVCFASFVGEEERLFTGSSDGVLKEWNPKLNPEDVWVKDVTSVDSGIRSGSFTSDFTNLLIGDSSGRAYILSTSTGHNEVDGDDRSDQDPVQEFSYVGEEADKPVGNFSGARAARELLASGQVVMGEHIRKGHAPPQRVIPLLEEDYSTKMERLWYEKEKKYMEERRKRMVPVVDQEGELVLDGDDGSGDESPPTPPGFNEILNSYCENRGPDC